MNTNLIRIVCLLDRSYSMKAVHAQSIDSYNEFVGKLKSDNNGACTLKLIQFDDRYEQHYDLPLQTVPALTDKTFEPRGMTAYYDALGRAIDELGAELALLPEGHRPGKVIFVTLTDGQENSSKTYTHGRVAEMIQHQREKYNWEFIYLGANHDAIAFATSLNIPVGSVMSYTSSVGDPEAMSFAFNSAANYVNTVRGGAVRGKSVNVAFSDEERTRSMNSAGPANHTYTTTDPNIKTEEPDAR